MSLYDNRTALIVVDVQNDFADPAGSLYVADGEKVVPVANREIAAARQAGSPVIYTQDWHPESTPHFSKNGGVWPVHCVAGTWGADFHPDLSVDGRVIRKGKGAEDGYSGFFTRDPETGARVETGLADLLGEYSIERVVVVGLALDYCVKATALDAIATGFSAKLLQDATRAVELEPGDGERAAEEMRTAGVEIMD